MTKDTLNTFLTDTVKRISGVEDIQPDIPLKDVLDSFDIVVAIMEVESEFSIDVDESAPIFEQPRMTLSEFADAIMENHTHSHAK